MTIESIFTVMGSNIGHQFGVAKIEIADIAIAKDNQILLNKIMGSNQILGTFIIEEYEGKKYKMLIVEEVKEKPLTLLEADEIDKTIKEAIKNMNIHPSKFVMANLIGY